MFEHRTGPVEYQQPVFDDDQKEAQEGDPVAERMHERHDKLMECLRDERDRQAENRWQMARDEDYRDGLQWEPEDAQTMMERGQAPLVFNKVAPVVGWITGTEKRTRVDFKVLPREPNDEASAEIKTKVLKYIGDVNRVQWHRSRAFDECVTAGLGWLEDGISTDPENDIIYSGHESWRHIYRDSRSREFDLSDARYLFRGKTIDRDVAQAMYPHAAAHLGSVSMTDDDRFRAVQDDIWYLGERLTNALETDARTRFGERSGFIATSSADTGRREVVRLIEAWYRVPEPVAFFANGPFAGQPCDLRNPMHAAAKKAGATTFNHVAMRMRCMIMTEDAPLWDGPSWYKHNQFPFTPIWCFRRARDGEPYGVVRQIRDPQDDFNKRRSKALHILSTRQVVADSDAFDDPEIARTEAARPDGVILKRPGSAVELVSSTPEMRANLELMAQDESLMQDVSGVHSELLGRETNATSGKAIIARQEQGTMVTAGVFDNWRLGMQMQGEKQLSLSEQYITAQKVIRIVGDRKPTEWLVVNQIDPATGQVTNDITASKADFVISEQDYRANLQQAAFEQIGAQLAAIGNFAPEMVVNLLDLWMDLADIPNKDEFVARIRKMTGQADPAKPPTPQEIQAQQQNQAKAAMVEQIAIETQAAQLDKLRAEASKAGAAVATERVSTLLSAIEAGAQVAMTPHLAPVADEIAREAGWESGAGADPDIPRVNGLNGTSPPQSGLSQPRKEQL